MTGNLSLLCKFVEKYMGTVRFGNDQFAPILGYGDLVQGNITINRVYYVKGPNHNLFSGNDLLTSNRGSDLYTISLQESNTTTPICLMAKVSPTQAWLWFRRLSHLNFDYINLISKKDVVTGFPKLKYVKDQLCSFFKVASINGKKYILLIVDDYSRYTWTLFLRSKDETPEFLKYFLMMIQRNLQASAAETMLSASKLLLFFWDEAIATACYTQNRSIIIPTHEKRAYHIINDRKPSIKHLHIFGYTCYLTRDGENLDKIKEKGGSVHSEMSETSVVNDTSGLVPQQKKALDYENSDPVPQIQNVLPSADTTVPSQQ
nr:hypothetical protein [Tanacetum cinerariifolium]